MLHIAIEADGPTHLARNDSSHVLGATSMKRRHLERMGWEVINVTFEVGLRGAVRRVLVLDFGAGTHGDGVRSVVLRRRFRNMLSQGVTFFFFPLVLLSPPG